MSDLINADLALEKLKQGNHTYVQAIAEGTELATKLSITPSSQGQKPFAVILGCSDSRAPAELIFNQGLGDLFVVRVAGNIAAPSQIGSIEFACQTFGTQLIVVLGHSHCGAVKATVDALMEEAGDISPNIAAIVDRVMPAVLPTVNADSGQPKDKLIAQAVTANVEYATTSMQARSAVLRGLLKEGKVKIVGAEYNIDTGSVTFHE